MQVPFSKIMFPELFFGFVAPIGADVTTSLHEFRAYFQARNYTVIEIKVTDLFKTLKKFIAEKRELVDEPLLDRYNSYIAYGNQIREHFDDNSTLATQTVARIMKERLCIRDKADADTFSRNVYLIHQFKRKEEIDLLRSIYGQHFFQISVYSRRGSRVDYLARRFASSDNVAGALHYRHFAEKLIQDDENEIEKPYGQRVAKIFHDADFIISSDAPRTIKEQIYRFCELIFSSNAISPTRIEYGMFLAKAAALRTLDLSRQVGAAIFSKTGEVISLGSNEVPKALGGTYWPDEEYDDREFVRRHDSNDKRKREILAEIMKVTGSTVPLTSALADARVRDSQLMDALEYGRIVHAEMSSISDAARLGLSTSGGTLYCTTFPCHMCAKHIIAAGLGRVVFLEPYPKSLAFDLHADALQVEGGDRGAYQSFPAVQFEHFYGVTPRRYREIFERGKRKDGDGNFVEYVGGLPHPIIDLKFPIYPELEKWLIEGFVAQCKGVPILDEIQSQALS